MQAINICLGEGQNIFFTSDLHFGHKNIINFCNRPFSDVKDMENGLVNNWNCTVKGNDIVFNLGDFLWYNDSKFRKIVNILHGKIYLVPGNHDNPKTFNDHIEEMGGSSKLKVLEDLVQLTVTAQDWEARGWKHKSYTIFLCHYPMMTWPKRDISIQLFGHIHSQPGKTSGFDCNLPLHYNQYDVGVDNNNYTPISFIQMLNKINLNYERHNS